MGGTVSIQIVLGKHVKQSGLYIVTLRNEVPISVNAHDKRHAHKAITVTCDNCKFGKAEDLDRRKKNYDRTFGAEHVKFHVVATLTEIKRAELEILKKLDKYRIKGKTGRKNEWLEKISPTEVLIIIVETLKCLNVEYVPIVRSLDNSAT